MTASAAEIFAREDVRGLCAAMVESRGAGVNKMGTS
jgi:hypothetical protein